ncbi:MAG TPA: type II secretion system protein, partial [Propioniciclava sp.]|nr:type II secretion system protein [Propioniciclava sp.]
PALRRLAERPGCAGLAELADAWEIATRTGASLVDAVDVAVQRLAAQEEVDRVVATELAAARLSGIMMAVLPLVGLGLGYALGGNPVGFLIGQPVGWVCLNVGVGLACAGVAWIDAIAAGAEGRP